MVKGFAARDVVERFHEKYSPEPMSGCWLWLGNPSTGGYGRFRIGSQTNNTRRQVYAHIFSFELHKGPVPKGLQIDHRCRVRCCVNPRHLEAVTQKINLLRGDTIAARNKAKTHCPQGHAYEGKNLWTSKEGCRRCRACNRIRAYNKRHAI